MARPAPTILEEVFDTASYMKEQIITCEGIFVVTYKGKPFNIRQQNTIANFPPRYKKTVFVNKGHATNLVEKLNKRYGDYFALMEIL